MGHRLSVCLGALLLAAGCDGPDRTTNAAAPAEPAPNPVTEAKAPANGSSIMRPSVLEEVAASEPSAQPPPPEPLRAVIGFPEGGAALDDEARRALDALLADQRLQTGGAIVLRGHSDSAGSDADNRLTSRRRAEAVGTYLEEHGVDEVRLSVVALGEGRPVAPNVTLAGEPDETGRQRNRRVEVEVAPPPREPVAPRAGTGATAPTPAAQPSSGRKQASRPDPAG